MSQKPSPWRLVALVLLCGATSIAYAEQTPLPARDARQAARKPSVYVQQRQTKETVELDQLSPMPGCKQVGVEVTSRGIVHKCFDAMPVWKD